MQNYDLAAEDDNIFCSINQLTELLNSQDDRGLVLSLSAFAEDALGSLLKAFMLPSEATSQLLEGFNAPLGTFSARLKAAYALGLITKGQYEDLEHLRKIRNEFAHTWQTIDLNQLKIATHIKAMSYSLIDDCYPESIKKKMESSICWVQIELTSITGKLSDNETHIKLTGHQLVDGFTGNLTTQLRKARKKLNFILQHLNNSKGEEREFYKDRLKKLSLQLKSTIWPKTIKQKQEHLAIQSDVSNALNLINL